MADKVFDPKEWFEDVSKDVDLDDAATQAMATLLANPDIAKNIGNSVLRQSDYSRQSDELKTQKESAATTLAEAEELKAEATNFVTKQRDRDHNNLTLHDQLVADLATANKRFSDAGEETITRRVETPAADEKPEVKYLTEDDYRELEKTRDQNAISYSNTVVQLSNKFRNDFEKDFDPEPVVDYATKNGLTLKDAYNELYKDEYAVVAETKVQARIDAAVQEATIDLRSKNDFPEVDAGPSRVSGLDQPEADKLKTEGDRARAAVQGLRDIRSGKKQVTSIWND
jgi:hypothetical protein